MAKIVGCVPPFVGTRDNLTIYFMNGEYIIRTKSSLTGKRVKRDPAFAKTMKFAGWLKQGARIASRIYRQLPTDERVYKQYRELTGKAMLLLKEGFVTEDIITMLEAVYLPQSVEDAVSVSADVCREYSSESVDGYYSGKSSSNSNVNTGEYHKYYIGHSRKYSGECNSRYSSKYSSEYSSRRSSEGVRWSSG